MLTTEALVSEIKEKEKAPAGGGHAGRHGRHVLIPFRPSFSRPRREPGLFLYWGVSARQELLRRSRQCRGRPLQDPRGHRGGGEGGGGDRAGAEIVVIDNASEDRIADELARAFRAPG